MQQPERQKAPAGQGRDDDAGADIGHGRHHDQDAIPVSALRSTANRLPPYGKEVIEAIAAGRPINVYVFAGPSGWELARNRRAAHGPGNTMLLPPNEEATAYRWPCISGGLLIDARDLDRRAALDMARCIVGDGTPLAFVVGADFGFAVMAPIWRNRLANTRPA